MGCRAVLAIGGSAGGLPALVGMVASLPPQLPACVLVTTHTPENAPSRLPQILARAGALPAEHAEHGAPLETGRIYVAPPGRHLLVGNAVLQLSAGPRVGRHRPAVDVLFASAARWARDRVVAVVLSGALDDGAVGAALVARAGGRVIVQEPGLAPFSSMPRSALAAAPGAVAVPTAQLAAAAVVSINRVAGVDVDGVVESTMDRGGQMGSSANAGQGNDSGSSNGRAFSEEDGVHPTRMVCPECGGSLGRVDLPRISYFRCHVGHQFGPRTLEAAQADAAEAKLWMAVAALEEHATWARHLAEQQSGVADSHSDAEAYRHSAQRSADLAESVRSQIRPPGVDAPI